MIGVVRQVCQTTLCPVSPVTAASERPALRPAVGHISPVFSSSQLSGGVMTVASVLLLAAVTDGLTARDE